MQCLEIELLDRLRRHEAHARTLHCFGDRLGVCEAVLLPPEIRLQVLCRHQPGVMAERPKLSAQMVRATAIPIRHGGRLASRTITWLRDSLRRRTMFHRTR